MKTVTQYGRQLWVIGTPISHTLSPPIHNAAFEAAELPHRYFALEVSKEELGTFLTVFKELNGLGANLTLPLKEGIREYVEQESESVSKTGAANTLYWGSNGELALENTDVYGFKQLVAPWNDRIASDGALLLGAGGAARACLMGLKEFGLTEVLLWNRTTSKAEVLADRFSGIEVRVLSDGELRAGEYEVPLVVNSTSLGLEQDDPSPFPEDCITEDMVGVDLIYGRTTRFQRDFQNFGAGAVGGLDMLLKQAARSWELWTGREPDLSAMKAAVDESGSES